MEIGKKIGREEMGKIEAVKSIQQQMGHEFL